MMDDTLQGADNPLGKLAAHLQARYASSGGGDAVVLRLETLGHPIQQADVDDESLSALADQYPLGDAGAFVPAITRLSDVYRRLLYEAVPSAEPDPAFYQMKGRAIANMESSLLAPSSPIPIRYLGSTAKPVAWFSDSSYWESFDSAFSRSSIRPASFGIGAAGEQPRALIPAPVLPMRWIHISAEESIHSGAAPLMLPLAGTAAKEVPAPVSLDGRMAFMRATVAAPVDAPPATTPRLLLQYCIVYLNRPWLDAALFTLHRHWMVPAMAAGEMSSSPVNFRQLPVAMVVVRNFSAQAEWSETDTAQMSVAASLGPFSLVGASLVPGLNKLENPATQIIGWLCSPLPDLPPNSGIDSAQASTVHLFIEVEQAGWYMAKFALTWLEPGAGPHPVSRSWGSVAVGKGFSHRITMAPGAHSLHLQAWELSGKSLCDRQLASPDNQRYRVTGTVWEPGLDVLAST